MKRFFCQIGILHCVSCEIQLGILQWSFCCYFDWNCWHVVTLNLAGLCLLKLRLGMESKNTFPLEANIWRGPYHLSSCLCRSGCVIVHAHGLQGWGLNWRWGEKGVAVYWSSFQQYPWEASAEIDARELVWKLQRLPEEAVGGSLWFSAEAEFI